MFFLLGDIVMTALSLYLAFLLRFDFAVTHEFRQMFVNVVVLFIAVKLTVFILFRLYKITWRYVGLNDLWNIVTALIVAESILMAVVLIPLHDRLRLFLSFYIPGFPRSIFLIDAIVSLTLLSGLRISKRLFLEVFRERALRKHGKRTVIVGSGHTGEMIVRDMAKKNFSEFYPIGFLDDDNNKHGSYIHGLKVFGPCGQLRTVILKYRVEAVIIAIPSLNYKVLRNIYNTARESHIRSVKIIPHIYDFQQPHINLKSLEDIRVEDLIGRQSVEIDHGEIDGLISGNCVLITGAGGSIGSEITKQACGFSPDKVILFDNDETWLHNMELRLNRAFPYLKGKLFFLAGDIRDKDRVDEVFAGFSPDIVFHSAAYKHVPMMESNPKEAVKVNIFGTYTVAKAAAEHHAKKFIMISTDKAVRPTSVMGATKRIAENICCALNTINSTEFISVRFGNVLGSRGSVLPLFLKQLKAGGPLTVTHKDMVRYFMTIPEAVSLVLQASVIGKGAEVLILDMGEPIKILSMAEDLIRLHGLEPYRDIDIEFVGVRPGEKLFEEILTAEEGTVATKHDKVFIGKETEKYSAAEIETMLLEFETHLRTGRLSGEEKIKNLLRKYVKHYDGGD